MFSAAVGRGLLLVVPVYLCLIVIDEHATGRHTYMCRAARRVDCLRAQQKGFQAPRSLLDAVLDLLCLCLCVRHLDSPLIYHTQ